MSGRVDAERRRLRPEHLIEVPAVIVTFVMMVHVTANALLRTFANRPVQDTLELVQYWYMPLLAFLGFVAAQHRGQHIAADLLYGKLPRPTRRFVLCGGFVIGAVLALGFARYGLTEAVHAYDIKQTAGVSALPSWPMYFLVPLAFGIMTVQFALAAGRAITRPAEDEHPEAEISAVDQVPVAPAAEASATGRDR